MARLTEWLSGVGWVGAAGGRIGDFCPCSTFCMACIAPLSLCTNHRLAQILAQSQASAADTQPATLSGFPLHHALVKRCLFAVAGSAAETSMADATGGHGSLLMRQDPDLWTRCLTLPEICGAGIALSPVSADSTVRPLKRCAVADCAVCCRSYRLTAAALGDLRNRQTVRMDAVLQPDDRLAVGEFDFLVLEVLSLRYAAFAAGHVRHTAWACRGAGMCGAARNERSANPAGEPFRRSNRRLDGALIGDNLCAIAA